MSDIVRRQDVIDYLVTNMAWYDEEEREVDGDEKRSIITDLINGVPSAKLNNKVHLCDSCEYTYETCPSHDEDAIFGDNDNFNICACNEYIPIVKRET